MEIATHGSVPQKRLVKATFRLGLEIYTVDVNKGTTVAEQLVSMKEESMKILKEFITKHNVPNEVPDELIESPSDEEEEDVPEISRVKSKKTKLTQ